VPYTLKIDTQDGRRFSATLSSQRASETLVGVISRTGTIFLADDDGTDYATLIGPDRMEICHLRSGSETRIAACANSAASPERVPPGVGVIFASRTRRESGRRSP
jgi:hypothetical protein